MSWPQKIGAVDVGPHDVARLDRKLDTTDAERRRLIDLYQAGLLELPELQRRAADVEHRRRVHDFAARIHAVIDTLDDIQKQQLLRLLIEDVRVTGWHVQIRLRIPLDDNPDNPRPPGPTPAPDQDSPVSTEDRLRSLGSHQPTVPPQDRGRGDQAILAQHRGQSSDQGGEECAVGPVEVRPRVGSAEYRDLVA